MLNLFPKPPAFVDHLSVAVMYVCIDVLLHTIKTAAALDVILVHRIYVLLTHCMQL